MTARGAAAFLGSVPKVVWDTAYAVATALWAVLRHVA